MTMPTLFISHGSPDLILRNTPAKLFLENLSKTLPIPKAILIISPHWSTYELNITANVEKTTIYDFGGFPDPLYQMSYASPSDEALTTEIITLLKQNGFNVHNNPKRGLDHGAWMPLSLIYPQKNIPVIQLSLLALEPPKVHYQIGQILKEFRKNDILIIASGTFTHNLKDSFHLMKNNQYEKELPYTKEFVQWFDENLNDDEKLLNYRTLVPNYHENHPTDEHFLPFFITLGTKLDGEKLIKIHDSVDMGMSMNAYKTA
jgi:4,5-DOPA dioxygenase extradiol